MPTPVYTTSKKRRIFPDSDDEDSLFDDPPPSPSPPPSPPQTKKQQHRPLQQSTAAGARTAHARRKKGAGKSPSESSAINIVQSNNEDRDIQRAKRMVEHIDVPSTITSKSQLQWHRTKKSDQHTQWSEEIYHHPCRICQPDEAMGLPDLLEPWDEAKMVLVQYIVFPNVGDDMKLVPRKELIPFHGITDKKTRLRRLNGGTVSIAPKSASAAVQGGSWCENLLDEYRKQRAKEVRRNAKNSSNKKDKNKKQSSSSSVASSSTDVKVDVHVQCFYLDKVLQVVKGREGGGSDASGSDISDSDVDDDDDEENEPRSSRNSLGRSSNSSKIKGVSYSKRGGSRFNEDGGDASFSSSSSSDEDESTSSSQERDSRIQSRQRAVDIGSDDNSDTSSSSSDEEEQEASGRNRVLLRGDAKHSKSKNKDGLYVKRSAVRPRSSSAQKSDASSSGDDDDDESFSWSQERDNRIHARQQQEVLAARNQDSSSSSSNDDDDEPRPSSRTRPRSGNTNKSESKENDRTKRTANRKRESLPDTNDSISLSSDGDETPPRTNVHDRRLSKDKISRRNGNAHTSDEDRLSDDEDDDDDEPLEEPYTQDLGLYSDDEYMPNLLLDEAKAKEPIRPGDVVEYYSHVYVAGDKRGRRVATVLSVDPDRTPILVLENGEIIPNDTQVRRMQVMVGGTLRNHSGVFRPIENFKLVKCLPSGSSSISAGLAKEARRVGEVISRNMAKFQEKARADGFAPMDLMNNYKGANARKSSRLTPISERSSTSKSSGTFGGSSRGGGISSGGTDRTNWTSATRSAASSRSSGSTKNRVKVDGRKKMPNSYSVPSSSSDSSSSEDEFIQVSSLKAKQKSTSLPKKDDRKQKSAAENIQKDVPSSDHSSSSSEEEFDKPAGITVNTNRPISSGGKAKSTKGSSIFQDLSLLPSSSSSDDESSTTSNEDVLRRDTEQSLAAKNEIRKTNKRKSPNQNTPIASSGMARRKAHKRDEWDTSPRKSTSSRSTGRDSLSFDSSTDDDFEHKSRRIIVCEKKEPRRTSTSKKNMKSSTPEGRKKSAASSPIVDLTSSDEKKTTKSGWLSPIGNKKTKTKQQPKQQRRKKSKVSSRKATTLAYPQLETTGFSTGFSLTRNK